MKTSAFGSSNVDDTLGSDSVKMSIDPNSIDHLMLNLTNLYSDPTLAVIREYASNAYDSHIRAGMDKPIIVSFPTEFKLFFTVEDFGVGMSKQEIIDIYSKYGLSTKSNTNSEIGAFGLGAKSALAIADRFDITARKDGVETIAYVEKNSKGVGVVHFVSEKPTNQPNGFKISVPVDFSKVSRFQTHRTFFDTWLPNKAVIDGKPAAGVQYSENWVEVNPTGGSPVGWVETHSTPQRHKGSWGYNNPRNFLRFCIEGIAYPFPDNFQLLDSRNGKVGDGSLVERLRNVLIYDNNIILNIPIGSVDLTPNREALMNTDKTNATLEALLEDFIENVRISVGERFNSFNKTEALKFAANNLGLLADETASASSCERTVFSTKRPEFYGFALNGVDVPTWLKFENNEFAYVGTSAKKVEFGSYIPLFEVFNEDSFRTNVTAVLVETTDLSSETLELVRKNIKDYVKNLEGVNASNSIIAIISDKKDVCDNEWVLSAYRKVSVDTLYQTALKQRRERRSNAAKGLGNRPALAYAMAEFPANPVGVSTGFDITYVNSDTIGDGSGFVYVGLGEGVSPSANGVDSVEDSVKTVLSGGSKTVYADFISYAETALAGRKVVFLNKGKKSAAFLKRHPKAVSFSERVAEHIEETMSSKAFSKVEVTAMVSFHMSLKSWSNWNGETVPFMVFANNMDKVASNLKGHTSGINDKVLQRVVTDASVKGELYAFSRLFSLVPIKDSKQIVRIVEQAQELNYAERLSILSLASARYTSWGSNEAEQAVKLINSI